MSLSNLYFRGCFEQPSDEQKLALEGLNVEGDVVDKSCSREDINTCGMSIEQLFDTYPIYNPQKGLYKSWGDIEFPWEISELTPNLLIEESNTKWRVSTYRSLVAYKQGSRVLLIERDGYRISLYEANQDVLSFDGGFDFSKWDKICHIDTTIPAGLPSIEELLARFKLYELKLFDKNWSQYNAEWQDELKTISTSNCISQNLTFLEFEKCLRDKSTDGWDEARVRRDFFYRKGDVFIAYGPCEDTLCLYVVNGDFPATNENYEKYKEFDPKTEFWQKLYCVNTERNKCLEYQRTKTPELGYDVVRIGSKGHFVEMPVPYRLKPSSIDLNELSEFVFSPPPVVLTQEQIDSLPQPEEN